MPHEYGVSDATGTHCCCRRGRRRGQGPEPCDRPGYGGSAGDKGPVSSSQLGQGRPESISRQASSCELGQGRIGDRPSGTPPQASSCKLSQGRGDLVTGTVEPASSFQLSLNSIGHAAREGARASSGSLGSEGTPSTTGLNPPAAAGAGGPSGAEEAAGRQKSRIFTVLYLFAGKRRRSDIRAFLQSLCDEQNVQLDLLEVDWELHGEDDDLSKSDIWEALRKRIQSGEFIAIIVSPPCHTHSRAVWSNREGSAPVRDGPPQRVSLASRCKSGQVRDGEPPRGPFAGGHRLGL